MRQLRTKYFAEEYDDRVEDDVFLQKRQDRNNALIAGTTAGLLTLPYVGYRANQKMEADFKRDANANAMPPEELEGWRHEVANKEKDNAQLKNKIADLEQKIKNRGPKRPQPEYKGGDLKEHFQDLMDYYKENDLDSDLEHAKKRYKINEDAIKIKKESISKFDHKKFEEGSKLAGKKLRNAALLSAGLVGAAYGGTRLYQHFKNKKKEENN